MTCDCCEQDPCTCVKTSTNPLIRDTSHKMQNGMDRAQFGEALYEAVRLIGCIKGVQDHMNAVVHKGLGYLMKDLKTKMETLKKELALALGKVTAAEMAEIHERFPIVRTL